MIQIRYATRLNGKPAVTKYMIVPIRIEKITYSTSCRKYIMIPSVGFAFCNNLSITIDEGGASKKKIKQT